MYNQNSNDDMLIKEERPYLANELRATLTDVLVSNGCKTYAAISA